MTQKDDEDPPSEIGSTAKEFLQGELELERGSEAVENFKATDWGDFFIATYGVGLVLSFFAVIFLLVMLLLLMISSASTPTGLAFNVVTGAGTIVSIIWFFSHLLVRAVDTTVKQKLPYEEELRPIAGKFTSIIGIDMNERSLHLWKAVVLGFSISLLIIYRVSFILDYTILAPPFDPLLLVYWLLVFSLDLGYIGLFLTTISLGHNTLTEFSKSSD